MEELDLLCFLVVQIVPLLLGVQEVLHLFVTSSGDISRQMMYGFGCVNLIVMIAVPSGAPMTRPPTALRRPQPPGTRPPASHGQPPSSVPQRHSMSSYNATSSALNRKKVMVGKKVAAAAAMKALPEERFYPAESNYFFF